MALADSATSKHASFVKPAEQMPEYTQSPPRNILQLTTWGQVVSCWFHFGVLISQPFRDASVLITALTLEGKARRAHPRFRGGRRAHDKQAHVLHVTEFP